MVDVLVVGGGPAGLSAAVNACARGATCVILSNDIALNPLARSPKVDNYLGMRGVSGLSMLETMKSEALAAGAQWRQGHALSVASVGDSFLVAVGSDMLEAKRVILAIGVHQPKRLDGETEWIGRGVSYCATCDGMLYRSKRAIVTGDADDLAHEAALLKRIGVQVTVVTAQRPQGLSEDVAFVQAKPERIDKKEDMLLIAAGKEYGADVIFVLRNEQAVDTLVPGLATNGRFILTDDKKETNIPGLYAAGDCTGKPLQVAKAVADGLLAAWSATDALK